MVAPSMLSFDVENPLLVAGMRLLAKKEEVKLDYTIMAVMVFTLGLILVVELGRHYIDHKAETHPFVQSVLVSVYSERKLPCWWWLLLKVKVEKVENMRSIVHPCYVSASSHEILLVANPSSPPSSELLFTQSLLWVLSKLLCTFYFRTMMASTWIRRRCLNTVIFCFSLQLFSTHS
jgi:hypothetical protein